MAIPKVYDGSSWVVGEPKVYDGSAFGGAAKFYDGTVWVDLISLAVSPDTSDVIRNTFFETAYAYIEFRSTGVEYDNTLDNDPTTDQSRGNWLDAGDAADVWIERTINSGSLGVDAGSGRLQLSTSRTFGVSAFGTTSTANVTFKFYDAASGGNEIGSTTIDLTATGTN